MEKEFDVFGIGSPLVDIFIEAEDHHIVELELNKGEMHLIDHEKFEDIQNKIKDKSVKTSPAGDIANTMVGVARMGGRSVFCGQIGKDKNGEVFEEVMLSDNVKPILPRCDKTYTGQVIAFVTKDAERTMTVHLGASVGLKKEDGIFDDLKKSKFLYTSAYALDAKDMKETVLHAMEIAKQNGIKIAFDLANPGNVRSYMEQLKVIIPKYVDVLFANEEEAKEYTGKEEKDALEEISKNVEVAVVKLGSKGSLIQRGGEVIDFKIKPEKAVDTTGAGDIFAAGFIFGLTRTNDLEICVKIASFASAKIVQQFGARLEEEIKDDVELILEGKNV